MTYITQLTGRKAMSISHIMVMVLTGFVLVALHSSTVQAQWATNGTDISNTNTGNVGIGTTSPTSKLEIQAADGPLTLSQAGVPGKVTLQAAIGTDLQISANAKYVNPTWNRFDTTRPAWNILAAPSGDYAGIRRAPAGAGAIVWTDFLRITNTGNVGIGTTSPGNLLHLNSGTTPANTQVRITANGLGSLSLLTYAADNIQLGFDQDWSGSAVIARNTSAARIIKNAGKLTFSGKTGLTVGSSFTPTDRLSIDLATGNVGIGTTTPSSKLHVVSSTDNSTSLLSLDTGVHGGTSMVVYGTANNESGFDMSVYRAGQYFSRFGVSNFGNVYLQSGGGSVGIGTSTPNASYKLDVNGSTNVTGNLNASGTITGGNIVAKYQDVAEWVQSSQELRAGTVVVLDQTRSNQVIASSQAYDTRVAGVISLQPGITLGENGAGKVLVATTGRVKVKVDATAGPIHLGDLLVSSDKEGVAQKSEPLSLGGVLIHRPGTLIGKALEPLEKGTGEILVLLSLQ